MIFVQNHCCALVQSQLNLVSSIPNVCYDSQMELLCAPMFTFWFFFISIAIKLIGVNWPLKSGMACIYIYTYRAYTEHMYRCLVTVTEYNCCLAISKCLLLISFTICTVIWTLLAKYTKYNGHMHQLQHLYGRKYF